MIGMRVIALALSIASFLPCSASADWQYTRWGMSLQDLLKIKGQSITEVPPESRQARSGQQRLAITTYSAGGQTFATAFYFDERKRLQLVVLQQEGVAAIKADEMKAALLSRYGEPPTKRSRDSWQWLDLKANNIVQLYWIPSLSVLNILYSPGNAEAAKGL